MSKFGNPILIGANNRNMANNKQRSLNNTENLFFVEILYLSISLFGLRSS